MGAKRLLLIPATLVTAFLAVAFVSPTAASGALRAVVPNLHLVAVSSASALNASQEGSTTAGSSGSASPGSGSHALSSELEAASRQIVSDSVHSVSTPSQENCGRFGHGFHGGKHLFVCPNRPFPPPPNH